MKVHNHRMKILPKYYKNLIKEPKEYNKDSRKDNDGNNDIN